MKKVFFIILALPVLPIYIICYLLAWLFDTIDDWQLSHRLSMFFEWASEGIWKLRDIVYKWIMEDKV